MATHHVKLAGRSDRERWNAYASNHPAAGLFHLFGWRDAIHATYGHDTYYLMAVEGEPSNDGIVGILPLVHLSSFVFGNSLVSLPFVDGGGVLAKCSEAEKSLLSEAIDLAQRIGADSIDIRSERAIATWDDSNPAADAELLAPVRVGKRSSKVRMVLDLPASSEEFFKSLKSKLRSQINKPLREGCTCVIGGLELLEDFYSVFLVNMRDLGSPVHSRDLMQHVLMEFPERSRIIVVYHSGTPIASALIAGYNGILRNPWASSDRRYARMSPNMLLYFRMLEFACDNGYKSFDFGRSTKGEGTYKFKEQWGAESAPLHWYLMSLGGTLPAPDSVGKERFELAARCWKRLPLALTRVIGPRIRKHISL